jgi:SMODS-associating 2TM, beta-strand rich effector domain
MSRHILVQTVAGTVLAVFAFGIWFSGDEFKIGWLRFFSAAVLAAMGLLTLWDHVLWRLPLLQRFSAIKRDVRGTWKGQLESFWIDPVSDRPPPPKTVFLVVRQTASAVTCVLLTDESRSVSSFGVITQDETVASLDYMYLNRPGSRVEHRSRMHHGSASLAISGRPATRLSGRYWTDRDSRGELDFGARSPRPVDDYEEARALFGVHFPGPG